jgi:hypothetical protein
MPAPALEAAASSERTVSPFEYKSEQPELAAQDDGKSVHHGPAQVTHCDIPPCPSPQEQADALTSSATSNSPPAVATKGVQKRRKGPNICLHGRVWSVCRQCGGGSICQHNRRRSVCKDCGGGGICLHGKQKTQCKACGGACVCPHGKQKSQCKECGGGSICPHDRVRSKCRECGGGSICRHKKRRSMCVECGGGSVCVHGKRKLMCKLCFEPALPTLPRATPPPPKNFQEFLKTLSRAPPFAPVPSACAIAATPILQFPTAADSFASMLAATTPFSNMELFQLMAASNSQPPTMLAAPLPFLNPFVASMLLGVNPILTQPQFGCGALPDLPLSQSLGAFQNPLAFSDT